MIVFDIETGKNPNAESIISRMRFKADARLKDPVKIEADLAEKKRAALDKAALYWWTGEVAQISASTIHGSEVYSENIGSMGSEGILLAHFFDWLSLIKAEKCVGQKAMTFDKPYVIGRAMYNDLHIHNSLKPWKVEDLDDIFGKGYSSQTSSLDNYALGLGLDTKIMDSALIPGLVAEKKWDEVKEHCDRDLQITREIFRRYFA